MLLCVGKLIICRVTGIAHRRPNKDLLEVANPVRNDETGLWQCPFCEKKDFPELSEVASLLDCFQILAVIISAGKVATCLENLENRNVSGSLTARIRKISAKCLQRNLIDETICKSYTGV